MNFYNLEYPPGYKNSASALSGGCGSDKAWIDLVPDKIFGLDITEACKIHDYMYVIGGSRQDKIKADKLFYRNLKTIVLNNHNLAMRKSWLATIKLYYIAVRDFGDSSFNFTK